MKKFAIIGYPLTHSYSPKYFNQRFAEENINAEFIKMELESIDDNDVKQVLMQLDGFCVTIPYKQNIIPLLDEISDEAKEIGAVNCVAVDKQSGKTLLKGYNTDVLGFKNALTDFLSNAKIERALILGSGGAAKAVCYALQLMGIKYLIVSRTPKGSNEISYEQLRDYARVYFIDYKLIINTTPLGTYPNVDTVPQIPYELLDTSHYLYDLVYNPENTKFMKNGQKQEAKTCNGYSMLIGQAIENWKIWRIS